MVVTALHKEKQNTQKRPQQQQKNSSIDIKQIFQKHKDGHSPVANCKRMHIIYLKYAFTMDMY